MNKITENRIITLHAGDSLEAPLFLNIGSGWRPIRYILQDNDIVYVGIMEPGQSFKHALIRKVLTKADLNKWGDPVLKLKPEDTEYLMPGLYYYEVKLASGIDENSDDIFDSVNIITAIPKTKIYVLE